MLALQQAYELKIALLDYLKATFTFQDKKVERAFLWLPMGRMCKNSITWPRFAP